MEIKIRKPLSVSVFMWPFRLSTLERMLFKPIPAPESGLFFDPLSEIIS